MNTGIISSGVRILELPTGISLNDNDVLVIVQGGVTKQIAVSGNKGYLKNYFDGLYQNINLNLTGLNTYNQGNFTGALDYKGTHVLTGIIAGTNTTVSNNNNGSFTISSTASSIAGTKTYCTFAADDNMPPGTGFTYYDLVNDKLVLSFPQSGDSYAVFGGIIPESAILTSGLRVRLHWNSATTGKNVRWQTEFARNNTNLGVDSYDTAVLATATTSANPNFTIMTEIINSNLDGIVTGDSFFLRIARKGSDAVNDTMITGSAQLSFVEIRGI